MIGRQAGGVEYYLDHPHVSRLHASVAVASGRVILADLGSSNGTFVNGRRLSRPATLSPGDRIDIGPFSLQFDGSGLVSRSRSNNIELVAYGLGRTVQDRSTPYFRRYVTDRLPSAPERESVNTAKRIGRRTNAVRQVSVLSRRYVSIWRGDKNALIAMLGQCLIVAILLGLVFGDLGAISRPAERVPRTVNLFLLLVVSCYWFGCNTAAKELIKERVIFLRERDFNLRVGAYYISKLLVLALIVTIQATLLFGFVRWSCALPGPALPEWITLVALAIAGTTMGLLISALAQSEEVAAALVPMVVVPQIILAGVVAPLKGLSWLISKGFITVHWAQQALERTLPDADLRLLGREEPAWFGPVAIVLSHAALAAVLTIIVLSRTEGRNRR